MSGLGEGEGGLRNSGGAWHSAKAPPPQEALLTLPGAGGGNTSPPRGAAPGLFAAVPLAPGVGSSGAGAAPPSQRPGPPPASAR